MRRLLSLLFARKDCDAAQLVVFDGRVCGEGSESGCSIWSDAERGYCVVQAEKQRGRERQT